MRLVSSLAATVTALEAETVERWERVPVMAAVIVRPVRSLETTAAARAFWPDSTPAAAMVRRSALSAAVTATRPDSSSLESGSTPAVTLDDAIDAVVPPPSEVTRTAPPAERADLSPQRETVVAIDPATVRSFASLIAVTSTEPTVAVTIEPSLMVAVRWTSRSVTFTDAAAVTVESATTAPMANDQTALLPASGMLSWPTSGSSAVQSASAGLPLVARTRTRPRGTVIRDRSTFAVPRVVEFTTVTAAPMLVESVPLPSRLSTKPPDAVTSSIAVVASTETSPPASAITTVLSAIAASTAGSMFATATNPATLEPVLLLLAKTAVALPPVLTTEPPPEAVITVDCSVAFTSRLPAAKVRFAAVTVAFVVAVALRIATDAPTARVRPLSAPDGPSPDFVRTRIDETLPTKEPATFQTRSSVVATTRAPARPVPVTRSSVAIVVVVSDWTATEPAKFTVSEPAPPTAPPAPLAAAVPIARALVAATSIVKPSIVARRMLASTVEPARISENAPERPAENFSSPPAVRMARPPELARMVESLRALTSSDLPAAVSIRPAWLTTLTTLSSTLVIATAPVAPIPMRSSETTERAMGSANGSSANSTRASSLSANVFLADFFPPAIAAGAITPPADVSTRTSPATSSRIPPISAASAAGRSPIRAVTSRSTRAIAVATPTSFSAPETEVPATGTR